MAMFLFFSALSFLQFTQADYTTTIDPTQTWGTWQGWGTSLAWWANVFGDRDDLADAVFSMNLEVSVNNATLPGLGMNIARYNAGASSSVQIGSEKMVSSPSCPSWKHIEGFWLNWDSANASSPSWDWNRDANQVAMLQKAKKRAGSTFVAELFSNSPMWWMCLNHNPSGSATGSENNLQVLCPFIPLVHTNCNLLCLSLVLELQSACCLSCCDCC
jgi:galactan endo-1,6-beta-galactosidase